MLIFDQLKKNDPPLRTLTWCVLAGMGILLVGLWYVQVISWRHYTENQMAQSFRTVRFPAIRGKILDRNGRALAENQATYHVNLYLDELRDLFKAEWRRSGPKGRRLKRTERAALEAQSRYRVVSNIVQNLSTIMHQPISLDFGGFMRHYTNQLALPLPLMTNLNPVQVALFLEHSGGLAGLDLEMQPTRVYPYLARGAHLVGYMVRDDSSVEDEEAFFNFRLPDYKGVIGIERGFDPQLRGRAGMKSVLVNNLGYRQSEEVWTDAEPGANVVLTIDVNLQQAAEQALQTAKSPHKPVRGAVVILDPNSGDILALVSSPGFDPNMFIPKISLEDSKALHDKETKPERNRATQENYRPGSIFKIVVALACLEAGLNPAEKIYNPPNPADPAHGHIKVGRRTIKDTAEPGYYDFKRGFIKSSNTYFITNGLIYGVENIVRIGQRLHLGERVDLPTWQDTPGSLPSPRRIRRGWSDGDTANLSIGQGEIDVTPLQMAIMVAAIANGGKVLWPRLVDRIEPQDPTSGELPLSSPSGRVRDDLGVSARTLKIIREAMLADVEDPEGLGAKAYIEGFRVCGKTGTAQNEQERRMGHTTWFASYAPYESPRYVVLVMVEEGSSGGGTCAPVAHAIYKAIQYWENQRSLKPTTVAQRQ